MRALSEYLADSLNRQNGNNFLQSMLEKQIQNAINGYINHLRNDVPKTVGWAMIEKQLIIALEHMEDPAKSHSERTEWVCPRYSYTNSGDNDNCGGSEMGDGRCGYPRP